MDKISIYNLTNHPEVQIIKLPPNFFGGSLSNAFTEAIEKVKNSNVKLVAVDLSQVEMINSMGLGLLVATYTSLKKNSIGFVLLSPNEKVKNLLKITHLDTIFKTYQNLDELIATL